MTELTEIPLVLNGRYLGKKGEVYTIVDYDLAGRMSYTVKLAENITGYAKVYDVAWTDLNALPQKWGMTNVDGVAVRSAPSESYPVIYILPKGAKLRLLRTEYNWYRVVLSMGRQAYVKVSDLVETTPPLQLIGNLYTVVSGDSLWKIALGFGITIDSLITANNMTLNQPLYIGQKLVIPVKTVESPKVVPQIIEIYTIKAGDTLSKIAQQRSMTVNELVKANNIFLNQPLYIGTKLGIPKIYEAIEMDTLPFVAMMFSTSAENLALLNNLNPKVPLKAHQRVMISL